MNKSNVSIIAKELAIQQSQVNTVINLLDEGASIPFISRYRKEMTGSLDELFIENISNRITSLREIDKRREAILASLEKLEKLTPELKKSIEEASSLTELEDIYLPYKPKRKTKATMAKERGLEPLATSIYRQSNINVYTEAAAYINEEKEVANEDDALQGARDIIAEWVNENRQVREVIRELFLNNGVISSKVLKSKEKEGQKYKDYFEWEESIKKTPSHRLLAMRRGEKEMILSLDIKPDADSAIRLIESKVIVASNESANQIKLAILDCYKRLLKPSMETEIRLFSKTKADKEAIDVFSENLRKLLLAAPLGQKNVLAIDPGFRTGCKIVCLDKLGSLLYNSAIFPNEPQNRIAEAGEEIKSLCNKYNIEAIAIGNGTASRETENFVKNLELPEHILVVMVNESGASIYSASAIAREEFPDYDVTVRGAVSIGRRMTDPLAELVKLDPKSIGVGQYQHDVDQNELKLGLDNVVMSCVNSVGVEVNTSSKELLSYVSGLGPQLAKSIVEYRNANGPFKNRKSLIKVSRLGDKAFEQAAGFLRIRNAKNPLDGSSVHPERYALVEKMSNDVGATVEELIKDATLRKKINLKSYITDSVGLPTLNDIMNELDKPGRDPRDKFEVFSFKEGVNEMNDLKVGMQLPGIVTNVTNFGAFVDIGVHQDGLVHISHMSDSFVRNPAEVVSVQGKVMATVLEVDMARKRISLSLKSDPFGKQVKTQKKKEPQQDGDLQSKLAMLKGKFGN